MTTIERSISINAPIEAVEQVTLDGQRLPEWYAGIEQAEPDAVYPEPGGKVKMLYKAAGINFTITMTSLERVPNQSVTYKMEGMITGTNHWTTTAEGNGTRLAASFNYEIPGGVLGQALNKLVVERMNAENLEKSLSNVKALVEG